MRDHRLARVKRFGLVSAAVGVTLVAAACGSSSETSTPSARASKPPTSAGCVKDFGVACYSPKQLQRAYDLAPLYAKGFDGKGRTIVIIDPYGSPTLATDLATFDHALGLPAPPSLRVLQLVGKVPAFNATNAEMVEKAGEATGDVETAHEIAPGASILVIETPEGETPTGGGFSQFIAADNYVATHNLGDVISQSFGLPEENVKRSVLLSVRYALSTPNTITSPSWPLPTTLASPARRRQEHSTTTRSSTGRRPTRS